MVNSNKREFVIGSIEILYDIIYTQSRARSWTTCPFEVAFPHAPNIEQAPLVSSPIMWILLRYLNSICDSSHLLIVFFVSIWKSNAIIKVKDSPKSKVRNTFLQEIWNFLRNTILYLLFNVVPKLGNKSFKLIFEQLSLSKTHLIH